MYKKCVPYAVSCLPSLLAQPGSHHEAGGIFAAGRGNVLWLAKERLSAFCSGESFMHLSAPSKGHRFASVQIKYQEM